MRQNPRDCYNFMRQNNARVCGTAAADTASICCGISTKVIAHIALSHRTLGATQPSDYLEISLNVMGRWAKGLNHGNLK